MKSSETGLILILSAILLALCLRLPELELRPMHTDEAVHAVKFGRLLEFHEYIYDYNEYHGPTLNYFNLIPAWLAGTQKITQVNEFLLRVVPVFFGVLLIVLHLWLIPGLGSRIVAFSAVLLAVSPAFVYYSRYYIQEILLVCFTCGIIAAGYRYLRSRKLLWILLTGMFIGLAHATKETCVIAFGSMILALLLVYLTHKKFLTAGRPKINILHLFLMLAAAVLVSAAFYSSFFTHIPGVLDSLRFWSTYLDRAGQNDFHTHPWYYYLQLLLYNHEPNRPLWTEGLIVILALIGLLAIFTPRGKAILTAQTNISLPLLRFLAFYTLLMAILYSAIPYKTPWCMLGFLHGFILLAAVAIVVLFALLKAIPWKIIFGIFLLAGIVHLIWQGYQADYKYPADTANPYVYGHTSPDIYPIVDRIEAVAQIAPQGRDMNIAVICPAHDYWPLPWYLRSFSRVRWLDRVTDQIAGCDLVMASPALEDELIEKLYQLPPPGQKNLYVPLFDTYLELRPAVELRGYLTSDLQQRLNASQQKPDTTP